MTAPATVAEIRHAAADYIETHGWTKGRYVDQQGHVDIEGAVKAVTFGDPDADRGGDWFNQEDDQYRRVINILDDDAERVTDGKVDTAIAWNDMECPDQATAVAFLRDTLPRAAS